MNERKPGISSALGTVNHGGSQRKVLTVADPTDEDDVQVRSFSSGSFEDNSEESLKKVINDDELEFLAQNRERLQSSRRESHQQKNKIPEGLKQRLEILTGIGRLTEDIIVEGITFSLRSLKPIETQEIVKALIGVDTQIMQSLEYRDQVLARSIYKIDGQDIDVVIGSKVVEERVNFIKNTLEESLVVFLYEAYQKLLTKNKFKNLGNTEVEVIENVKKS